LLIGKDDAGVEIIQEDVIVNGVIATPEHVMKDGVGTTQKLAVLDGANVIQENAGKSMFIDLPKALRQISF